MWRSIAIACLLAGCASGMTATTPVNMGEVIVTSPVDGMFVIDCMYASVAVNLHADTPEPLPGGCVILSGDGSPVDLHIEVTR